MKNTVTETLAVEVTKRVGGLVTETTTELAKRDIFGQITSKAASVATEAANVGNDVLQFVDNEIVQVKNYIALRIGITIAVIVVSFLFVCIPQTSLIIKWWINFFSFKWLRRTKKNNNQQNWEVHELQGREEQI